MKSRHIILGALALLPTTAEAQNTWGADWAMNSLNTEVRDSMLGVSGSTRQSSRSSSRRSPAFTPVNPNTRTPSFPFVSTPSSQRQATEGLISRASRNNPQAAKEVSAEMAKHNFFTIYDNIVAKTPYKANNASDVLASYLALGYAITHGTDTTTAQDRALRTQVALNAGSNPAFSLNRAGFAGGWLV